MGAIRRFTEIIFTLLGFIGILWLLPVNLGGTASFIIVTGTSMEPTLISGDLAFLKKQDSYQNGDIVAFYVNEGIVIHRIIGGSSEEGFLMQGDNKNSTDPWEPTQNEILGRMVFHIPGGGGFLQILRQKQILVALGGLAVLLVMDEPAKKKIYQRRRHPGVALNYGSSRNLSENFGIPEDWEMNYMNEKHGNIIWFELMFGITSILAIFFFAIAFLGFRSTVDKYENITLLEYQHKGDFVYTINTLASTLYPNGKLGPIDAIALSKGTLQSVSTKLANSLELSFTYRLDSNVPTEVKGILTPSAEISSGLGWTKTLSLGEPIQFSGPEVSAKFIVNFAEISSLIEIIQQETGNNLSGYTLKVKPIIEINGIIGSQFVEDTYIPQFTVTNSYLQLVLDSELSKVEQKTVQKEVLTPQEIDFLGLSIPVTTARRVGGLSSIFFLLVAAITGAVLFVGFGLKEAGKIQARYGSMIVSVTWVDLLNVKKAEVATIKDLVRIAQKENRAILHKEREDGSHLFFVTDGFLVYTYTVLTATKES